MRARDTRRKRAGDAVIHDAGGGHRLCLSLGDRRELRVGLDGGQAVLAPVLRDRLRQIFCAHVFCVRQGGRDGQDDAERDRLHPLPRLPRDEESSSVPDKANMRHGMTPGLRRIRPGPDPIGAQLTA